VHQGVAPLDFHNQRVRGTNVEILMRRESARLEKGVLASPGVPTVLNRVPQARVGSASPAAPGVDRARYLVMWAMGLIELNSNEDLGCLRDASTLLRRAADDFNITLSTSHDAPRGGLLAWQTKRLVSYVESNLGSKMAIRDLAGLVFLSPSHLSRVFKQRLGCTPMTYVAARRIERAKVMMTSTREELSSIASACGFADQSHLNKRFRHVVGISPGRWRRLSMMCAPEAATVRD
jgi:AraC-like DNA-binding protein